MSKWATSGVEFALRAAGALSVVMALLWIIGPNGTGAVGPDQVPGADRLATPTLSAWRDLPSVEVQLTERVDLDRAWDLSVGLGAIENGTAATGYAETWFAPTVAFFEPTRAQEVLHLVLNAGTWLVVAALWWLLAGVARSSSRESPFTVRNARRLTVVGALILVASVAYSVAGHFLARWMVESSSLGGRVAVAPYGLLQLPWASVGAAAGVLAIASVWRRGVALEAELEDLV